MMGPPRRRDFVSFILVSCAATLRILCWDDRYYGSNTFGPPIPNGVGGLVIARNVYALVTITIWFRSLQLLMTRCSSCATCILEMVVGTIFAQLSCMYRSVR